MHVAIEYDDGTQVEHRILPVDLVAFERHWKMGFSKAEADPRVEHALWLAWKSAVRSGRTNADFDAWMSTVADFVENEDEPAEGSDPLPQPSSSAPTSP